MAISSRMFVVPGSVPFPHPHVPGNMWLAHCSYVNYLLEPIAFHNNMYKVQAMLVLKSNAEHYCCIGNGRYAAEHWIHSHPNVKPSDLYTSPDYTWGYEGCREKYEEGDFEWKLGQLILHVNNNIVI
jgi:hypothetical protein